jgi:homoserine kinase
MSPRKAVVRAPATSANLGPGFDSLGMALDLWSTVTLEAHDDFVPPPEAPIAELVRLAARSLYVAAGIETPRGLSVRWESDVPVARGLGASAAARVGGLLAANALCGEPLNRDELLPLGAKLEGHADNVAPALFGGLQVVVQDSDRLLHISVPLPPQLKAVLLVPELAMPTNESRRLLPEKFSREDAVHNIGRAALLVAALAAGQLDMLDAATQDRLHQPARARLFPAMDAVFVAARRAGAHAAYLSGGGSTVLALVTDNEQEIADAMAQAAASAGFESRAFITAPSQKGAEIESIE